MGSDPALIKMGIFEFPFTSFDSNNLFFLISYENTENKKPQIKPEFPG